MKVGLPNLHTASSIGKLDAVSNRQVYCLTVFFATKNGRVSIARARLIFDDLCYAEPAAFTNHNTVCGKSITIISAND